VEVGARVLVVEGDPVIARLVYNTLVHKGHDVFVTDAGDQALEMAALLRPEVVILDAELSQPAGLEVLAALRSDLRTKSAVILLLVAEPGTDGIEAGADDELAKPFLPNELLSRVQTALRRARRSKVASPLTGLAGNFDIVREMEYLVAQEVPFALVHADLDGFRHYNNRYGYTRGDQVITTTGEIIVEAAAQVTGSPRFVGHIGADDFAVLLRPDDVPVVCDTIVSIFDAAVPSFYDDDDREAGGIVVKDRRGRAHRHPFLTIKMGVAANTHRQIDAAPEAAAIAGEVLAVAKSVSGSVWRIDRRREKREP
jgi:PleD family two-component response regulator